MEMKGIKKNEMVKEGVLGMGELGMECDGGNGEMNSDRRGLVDGVRIRVGEMGEGWVWVEGGK